MAPRKQKRWNILAIVSVALATILGVMALASIDVEPVRSRDSLRLSSASRALTTDQRQMASGSRLKARYGS